MQCLRSAERTIRGRVACRNRRKDEGGNVGQDNRGEDDEDECLSLFVAAVHDE